MRDDNPLLPPTSVHAHSFTDAGDHTHTHNDVMLVCMYMYSHTLTDRVEFSAGDDGDVVFTGEFFKACPHGRRQKGFLRVVDNRSQCTVIYIGVYGCVCV